jgi:hypothetical protein
MRVRRFAMAGSRGLLRRAADAHRVRLVGRGLGGRRCRKRSKGRADQQCGPRVVGSLAPESDANRPPPSHICGPQDRDSCSWWKMSFYCRTPPRDRARTEPRGRVRRARFSDTTGASKMERSPAETIRRFGIRVLMATSDSLARPVMTSEAHPCRGSPKSSDQPHSPSGSA